MRPLVSFLVFLWFSTVASAATLIVEVRDLRGANAVDAVVWAVPRGVTPPAARRSAVMDQKNRTFIPHVLAVQTGTSVRFPNSDDVQHQVYSFSAAKTFRLPLYTGTPANPIVFDKPGVAALGCNIHDRMSAYVVVVDTPYFATTDGKGPVTLEDLPAGTYDVHLWWPDMRRDATPVAVTVGASERRELSLTAR